MKIVIDARMYGLEHAGIGRYIVNLIQELKRLKTKDTSEVVASSTSSEVEETVEFCLLVRKSKLGEIKKEVGDFFRLVVVDAAHYSIKEQFLLPIQLFKLKPDLVHFPHFNVPIFWWGKQVVTIHDLIKHESRGAETTTRWPFFYWFKYLNYRFLVWLAIKRAAKIIVPSQWWQKELIRRYRLSSNKVVVTYEGVDKKFKVRQKIIQKTLKKFNVKRPFLLYVGSLYPHKNVERLVEAVASFSNRSNGDRIDSNKLEENSDNSRISLVIVCGRSVFYDRFKKKIKRMKAEKLVNLAGFVPDKDLSVLYSEAEAFVFPSLLEGFGLPGLEAMARGCPVAASNSSCLPEVYGAAALYFDPLDIKDMVEKILEVTRNTSTRNRLVKKGHEQVKKYSWQKMAKETLHVYSSLMMSNDFRIRLNNNQIKSKQTKIVLPNLSYKIMGTLFRVHNELGPSLLEKYYQRGVARELENSGLNFKQEVPVEIHYSNKSTGRYFLDFKVEELVILEIKAQRHHSPKFFKQALAYLKQTNLPLAIIANFRGDKLQYKRIVNPSFKSIDLSGKDLY